MATQSHTPSHSDLERVSERASVTPGVFPSIFSARNLPTVVLGFAIMAVVTLTERALDAVETGFALEWAILTLVALVTFGLFARTVVDATKSTQTWFSGYAKRARQEQSDARFWATAQRDPRVMSEIVSAQLRAESIAEQAAPLSSLQSNAKSEAEQRAEARYLSQLRFW